MTGRFPTEQSVRIEDDVFGVVREIQRLWPELTVQFFNPSMKPDVLDPPYRIVERCRDGVVRQVMQVWQLDNRVIERLKQIDQFNGFDPEKEIEKQNAKIKVEKDQKFKEEVTEMAQIAGAAVDSKNSTYSFRDKSGKMVTIRKDEDPTWQR